VLISAVIRHRHRDPLEAQLVELTARHRALFQEDRVRAEIVDEQRRYVAQGWSGRRNARPI
jgi:hypothetical protein